MKRSLLIIVSLMALIAMLGGPGLAAAQREPVDVVFMTTPFGTHMYASGAAAEQVFKKAGSWVRVKHQETPGAMYMYRYVVENLEKMKKGEAPHTLVMGAPDLLPFLLEARPPFEKVRWPGVKAVVPNPSVMGVYATFDPEIRTLRQLEGKKVCTGERSRPFQGILLDKPLFSLLGIYDDIRWSFLGSVGCKDAFLNNAVDALPLRFMGMVEIDDQGMMTTPRASGGPATLEVLNSGRKVHFIPMPPELLGKIRDIPGALVQHPIVFRKNAFEGLDQDLFGRAGPNCFIGDAAIPDDIVMEIVRVWHEHRAEFGKYADFLNYMPRTPYPIGADPEDVHPGVLRFMEEKGLPVPKVAR
ncbi:TAXI family TRAP transporter solute-binding subunit [Desulfatitalea alkaliphila]|uniref:TRAP transporter solute receptor, TAXI family n=1 Tax=Desulfatitalea alkaliphila TaxID=2929485 RepID=A0AA41R583_9BACT|nr:hypothetical protein [Desulfatitalea alkaliphila]MCJ8501041.1 hypothetical protein [Desulfatitalea alkaliphila]